MEEEERGLSVIIDIQKLENKLNKEYYMDIKNSTSICKIKTPIGDDEDDPVVVSVGPYHHRKKKLQSMNQIKWNWMNYILKINTKVTLEDYIKSLREVEHIARNYYTDEIEMDSNEFITMLLLDAFFILVSVYAIELTPNLSDISKEEDPNNEIKPLQFSFVAHDLFLVENQIPFCVLKIIYELFMGEENTAHSLSEKVSHYVMQILGHYPVSIKEDNGPAYFHHLLHLCHMYLEPSRNSELSFVQLNQLEGQTATCWRRALQYHAIGIKFKKRELDKNNPHSLLDVRFTNDILEIPTLTIDENTPSLFKSLVALELANPTFKNVFIAYVIFVYHLIRNAQDVTLLMTKGIIEHDLRGEEEVADLFKRISEGIVFDFTGKYFLKNICNDLEACYQSRMTLWNVWFRRITSAIGTRISQI